MSELKQAASLALSRRYGEREAPVGSVERLALDVEVAGARELVSFAMRSGALSWSCSCGIAECSHAHVALGLLADRAAAAPIVQTGKHALVRTAPADRRTVAYTQQSAQASPSLLSETLRDLVTAVVRSGLASGLSASIEEVLERLIAAAPVPLPLGISRFIGRLKKSIAERDADEAARVLHAASQLADDLASEAPQANTRARVLSWLGSLAHELPTAARMTDLRLVEIARELLSGVERAGVERRYMVDPTTGLFYREERAPSGQDASLGPCPRQLTELLALVEDTAPPRRVRLLQYAVTPVIDAETWEQLSQWALTDFGSLLGTYRENLTTFAGLCEPFAMVAPAGITSEAHASLSDGTGHLLPVLGPERAAVARCLRQLGEGGQLLWVAGRLLDRGGSLGLLPLSAVARRHGRISYAQM